MPSKTTGIWFEIDEKTNKRLTASAKANKRTKRQEANFRLCDHLSKFDDNMKRRTTN
ncbi:TraY domain-containing protein [Vibrio mediterranei]|uniref:Relaxosome protein TraY n=1 Tax=Vibrio mediterranei TaxID=689 RepID=A0ABX5DAJ0_9VIBR|nr:TraY domain-containing protein [Vibrio mediterranei]PCD85616.1 conjugal transfer protein TraY [Vibrio mediterranei]PRQ66495.1 conjugal transfer protein TraY [Vibrio mediterranei]